MHGVMSMHRGMGIGVVIDGQPQHFAASPMMMSGRVMVPMREIFEALGAKVMWNRSDRTVTAKRDGREVVLGVGKAEGMMNGKRMMLDAAPRMYDNRVFVPLRFVSDAMGAKVVWDAAARQVMITRREMVMGMMQEPPMMEQTEMVQGPRMMRQEEAPAPTPAAQPGDSPDRPASAGEKVYVDQGCNACHKINGKGGDIGPDLTHVGAAHDKDWLKKVITDPKSIDPNSSMPVYKLSGKELGELVDYLAGLK